MGINEMRVNIFKEIYQIMQTAKNLYIKNTRHQNV